MEPLQCISPPVIDFPTDTTRTALRLVACHTTFRLKVILSHASVFLPFAAACFAVLVQNHEMKASRSSRLGTSSGRSTSTPRCPHPTVCRVCSQSLSRILCCPKAIICIPWQISRPSSTDELDRYHGFGEEQLEMINHRNAEMIFPRLRLGAS